MKRTYPQLISLGAMIALAGFVTSGPLGFLIVKIVDPQPAWTSPSTFAANYHGIQDLPYFPGLLLIGGMMMLIVGHYFNYEGDSREVRFHLMLSLLLTTVFGALISFNYICQTTFVRHLALNYKPEYDSMIAIFSMANPLSLCWAIEMWGYGILGVATSLMAGYYLHKSNVIHWMLISNGILSVLGVIFTVVDISWVMTGSGLAAYMVWNALMIVLVILIHRDCRLREVYVVNGSNT